MNRNECIIMYSFYKDDYHAICFACVGRNSDSNLCDEGMFHTNVYDYSLICGVGGYGKDAIRFDIGETFDNTKHRILMTTSQCFLCNDKCLYPNINCDEILSTMKKYKEVIGLL